MKGRLKLAWTLFLSSVAVLIFAACTGVVALEQGLWLTAAINGGFVLFSVRLIAVQNRIIDDLTRLKRRDEARSG